MNYGCENCKHCRCYKGDYWTPDEYECTRIESGELDISQENFDRCWGDGEQWEDPENALCPDYEEQEPEPDYDGPEYDKYADERPSIYD